MDRFNEWNEIKKETHAKDFTLKEKGVKEKEEKKKKKRKRGQVFNLY